MEFHICMHFIGHPDFFHSRCSLINLIPFWFKSMTYLNFQTSLLIQKIIYKDQTFFDVAKRNLRKTRGRLEYTALYLPPNDTYLFKVKNRNTANVSDVILVSLLSALNIFHTLFWCLYWWLWTSKWRVGKCVNGAPTWAICNIFCCFSWANCNSTYEASISFFWNKEKTIPNYKQSNKTRITQFFIFTGRSDHANFFSI